MLKNIITRKEYLQWLSYEMYKKPDVQEMQLAIIATIVSGAAGNKNVKLEDFLIRKPQKQIRKNTNNSKIMKTNEVSAFFSSLL